MKKIGVVGLGIMGAGIVEVFAANGFEVVGVAESQTAIDQGKANLDKSLVRAVSKEKITPVQKEVIHNQVTWSVEFNSLKDCDLVIEAAPEILSLKKEIFSKLDSVVKPNCILATNTSSLPVSEIAVSTKRPENVIGFHFFNPAPVQKFVEVINTAVSSTEAISEALHLGRSLGKYIAQVSDQPGFIVNKLLLVYLNHAVQILDSNIATQQEIDSAMRKLAGYPMGPLELIDLIGIDTCVEILRTIHANSKNELHKPALGLLNRLEVGSLGRKSGQGFYDYSTRPEIPTSENSETMNAVFEELEIAYLGDALAMQASGYASESDIDNGMKLGCGLPLGPFERISQIGIDNLRTKQAALAKATGRNEYAPLPL